MASKSACELSSRSHSQTQLAFLAILPLLLTWCGPLAQPQTAPTQRQIADPASQAEAISRQGDFYALVIGVQNYKHYKPLGTPLSDAKEVASILRDQYGFKTQLLLDATHDEILDALGSYRTALSEDDNLLIYYAGHGNYDKGTDLAYWYPIEASENSPSHWINASEVTGQAKAIKARHVLVVTDSCYAGMLSRLPSPTREVPEERPLYLQKMIQRKSRNVMSSGGNEPVADDDRQGFPPGHSVFANTFLLGLKQYPTNEFSARELFNQYIFEQVSGRSGQVPGYDFIRDSDHDYGDFVFFRVPVVKNPAAAALNASTRDLLAKAKALYDSAAYVSALPFFQKAADAGETEAMAYLGDYYSTRSPQASGLQKENAKAADLYRKAADAGIPRAMLSLAYFHYSGYGGRQDYSEAFRWYRKAAGAGDTEGMRGLGWMYEYGYGTEKDFSQAVLWYRKAADAGNGPAMTNLGTMYYNGTGVAKDYAEAVRWYRSAAGAGDVSGMASLGYMYEHGYGVNADYAEALRLYRQAADASDAWGMTSLGYMYERGLGVNKDYAEAVRWYRRATDADDVVAMRRLGYMYFNGYGVDRDYAQSFAWYRKAADGGDVPGISWLGYMYENGYGVDRDSNEALRLYLKAAAMNDDYAKEQLRRLGHKPSS